MFQISVLISALGGHGLVAEFPITNFFTVAL